MLLQNHTITYIFDIICIRIYTIYHRGTQRNGKALRIQFQCRSWTETGWAHRLVSWKKWSSLQVLASMHWIYCDYHSCVCIDCSISSIEDYRTIFHCVPTLCSTLAPRRMELLSRSGWERHPVEVHDVHGLGQRNLRVLPAVAQTTHPNGAARNHQQPLESRVWPSEPHRLQDITVMLQL